jgi:hypothetical protein
MVGVMDPFGLLFGLLYLFYPGAGPGGTIQPTIPAFAGVYR